MEKQFSAYQERHYQALFGNKIEKKKPIQWELYNRKDRVIIVGAENFGLIITKEKQLLLQGIKKENLKRKPIY